MPRDQELTLPSSGSSRVATSGQSRSVCRSTIRTSTRSRCDLDCVAAHSRRRVVFHTHYALSSVIGFASDVAATEVLFTSLLVQSQVALQAQAARPVRVVGSSRSFRSSFLLAYAYRIDERLAAVTQSVESEADAATDGSLLPVLAGLAPPPSTRPWMSSSASCTPVVPAEGVTSLGWSRGLLAADRG